MKTRQENVYYRITITGRKGKNKYSACKIWKSSSINLKYLKVDNSFQYFEKRHLTEFLFY